MINDPFFLIGLRAGEYIDSVSKRIKTSISTPRVEYSGNVTLAGGTPLRAWGWSAATFGAGAILGWIAVAGKAKK
jgi:hypothetical protein